MKPGTTLWFIPAIILLTACADFGASPQDTWQITLDGIDMVSVGGTIEVVVRTQAEYEQLVYDRFTHPLEEYWEQNYESVLVFVMNQYPGLSEKEYQALVRDVFYSALPFKGTEDITHPDIDFSRYSLLGRSIDAAGCGQPGIDWNVFRLDESDLIRFTVTVEEVGDCEMGWYRILWVLVHRIPESYAVEYDMNFKTVGE